MDINYFKYHDKGSVDDILLDKKHVHNSNVEILHVIKGDGFITINDCLYPLTDNTVYFIKPMVLHCSAPEEIKNYYRSVANIKEDYLKELCNATGFDVFLEKMYNGVCIILDKNASSIVDKEFLTLSSVNKSEYSMAILNIISILSLAGAKVETSNNKTSEIISYINSNLSEKITLESICENTHISKYYLCHIFKDVTKMSIMTYILNQRIALAKNLMINTDRSISEIAIEAGFSCFSYFSKSFKNAEGLSPREFRKKYRP